MGREWTKAEIHELAIIFQARAEVGWNTLLSPETTMLVVAALHAYLPKPPTPPAKPNRFSVDMYGTGSCIYRLLDGEILDVAAWAKSTLVAHAAFDKLLTQYPRDEFMQKRGGWVERESGDRAPAGQHGG